MQKQLEAVALAYEAALDQSKLSEALNMIAEIGQAKGACLGIFEVCDNGLGNLKGVSASYPIDQYTEFSETHAEYETQFWIDFIELTKNAPEFTVFSEDALTDKTIDLMTIPSFVDFNNRFGAIRRLGVSLNHRAPWQDGIGLQYDAKYVEFPEFSRKELSEIAPYLSRATAMMRPVMALQEKHGMLLNVLDKLAIGVAVVSHTRDVILKNTSFEQLLDIGVLYVNLNNQLRARDNNVDAVLHRIVNRTSKTCVGSELEKGAFVSVPVEGRTEPICLDISPLGRRGKDSPREGWTIVFAVDPSWQTITDATNLGQSYSLTATEVKVCSLLLQGLSNREISDVRSCGIETIKYHVSNILGKTWSSNRTDLARLAATVEIPILD
jgi:DNA-binding CsgD family transcriptional regulator